MQKAEEVQLEKDHRKNSNFFSLMIEKTSSERFSKAAGYDLDERNLDLADQQHGQLSPNELNMGERDQFETKKQADVDVEAANEIELECLTPADRSCSSTFSSQPQKIDNSVLESPPSLWRQGWERGMDQLGLGNSFKPVVNKWAVDLGKNPK